MSPQPTSRETLMALARNPELIKVCAANGLVLIGKLVVLTLVLPDVQAKVWSKDMTEFQSLVSLFMSLTAILTSSHFGSFSDRFGRRVAAALFGVVSFLPSWCLLIFGMNKTGLYASSIGLIISGIGVNSNVLLLLASDVTDPSDRQVAFGAFAAATMLMNCVLLGIPSLLIMTFSVFSSSPIAVMAYQVVLSVLYFIVLATVRVPSEPRETEAKAQEGGAQAAERRTCFCTAALSAVVAPLRLVGHRSLRSLAAATFLVAFSGDLLMDVGSQFFRETLGLIPNGTLHQQQMVSVMSSLPSQVLVLPGYVVVGLLCKRVGSRKLLLLLIPVSAVLLTSGASLLVVPEFWFIGVVTVLQGYGQLLKVPLAHLVTIHASPGQQGEAMGFMGACEQAANMLGNLGVVVATPLLQRSGLKDPLWIYYPVGALFVLLAAIPVLGIGSTAEKDAEEEEGSDVPDNSDIECPSPLQPEQPGQPEQPRQPEQSLPPQQPKEQQQQQQQPSTQPDELLQQQRQQQPRSLRSLTPEFGLGFSRV